jgi:DNA polymerase-1
MSDQKTLFLLDGHALVYRAHYALIKRPLINSKGLNTSAIMGFTRTLWEIISKQKPTHLAVSFDVSDSTVFRKEMFPEYKANRNPQPEDITTAFPYIKQIVRGLNIPIYEMPGFEADDVIGTIAKRAEKEGFKVYMMTPDKDYAQLVSNNVFMYKPARFGNDVEILGEKEVLEKWRIKRVDQVIDVLGLQGDAVDNIPGIPGIGAKTAVKLLAKYDTIEGLIEHSHELKGKQKENVENFAEQGLLSKKLATIDLNVPVKYNAEDCRISEFNKPELTEVFKNLEFRTLANQILGTTTSTNTTGAKTDQSNKPTAGMQGSLFGDIPATGPVFPDTKENIVATKDISNVKHDYKIIETEEEQKELAALLAKEPILCFDTETTGLDANNAELVGLAFSIKEYEAYYVPVPADQVEAQKIVDIFKAVIEDENIIKIGQNIKYDYLILKWYGISLKGKIFDTMLAHYLLEPELRHNLNYLSQSYLDYSPVPIETLIGKRGKNQLSMRDVSMDKIKEYAGEDADLTLQLKNKLEKEIKKEGMEELYWNTEAPLVDVLVEIEYNGIRVDAEFLAIYSIELGEKLAINEKAIHEKAGLKFNIASPKQVGEVLFTHLKIPYRWRKTKSGQFSTNEEKLSEMALDHPIVADILRHRGLAKLKSTYVDALPKLINPKTGRVHSSFSQALTSTGRLSSKDPNLQNIPIRTPEGRKVREAFTPKDENHLLLAADYSQIELRLIAEISGDEAMLEAFQKGHDIHQATAAKVYEVPLEEVTPDQRRNAKTVNFSIIYGAGATNLSKQLGIKRTEASELIANYFKQYQGLKNYMDNQIESAREKGYVETLLGRRRYLRDINSKNGMIRSHAERNAINTPIQGTAADMIKMAMISIHKAFKDNNFKSKMILQVHDELVFDAHKDELELIKPIIEKHMKEAIPNLKVPILVGMDVGNNWLEAH